MKNRETNIEGGKFFQTEQGEVVISEMTFLYAETPVEFTQESEITTINYTYTEIEQEKRLLIYRTLSDLQGPANNHFECTRSY